MTPIKDKPPTQDEQEITPQISLSQWELAKEAPDNEPKRITRYFSKNDAASWLWVKFVDVYEANSWKWEWYYPSGTFYTNCNGGIEAPPSGHYWSSVKHACGIFVKDFPPASNPGNWNVKFYLDGTGKLIDTNFVVSYQFKESKMVKGVDGDSNPGAETTSFLTTDDAAYTWFRLENIADPLHIEYKWYAPDGSLYKTYTYDTKDPGTDSKWDWYKLWNRIDIKNNPPATKCGDWKVEVHIDGKFRYSQGFTISGCTPPKKCDIQQLEASVEKDGEVFNNIKTVHKFESKYDASYKDYNYDINFDLFGPSGSKVSSWSSTGTLKPDWWVKWWVQYGVPTGGWQPGSYTSKATMTGQCDGQSQTASNEAYPNIPTPPPTPGAPPPTDFCDGKIDLRASDKYGNNLQGLKIYLDGSLEGTTTADGKRSITTADNGCGKTHTIKATCPNDNLCTEKTSTISYDGDINTLGFVCNCPGLIPGLDILTESDSHKYQKNAKVKLNADVKNAGGSLVKNVLLTIYDPFLGANKIYNIDSGSASYGTEASRTGLQAFFLSAYKQGYLPGMTKHKIVVEDKSGKINLNAKNPDNTPLQSALTYLNNEFKGATDKNGEKIIDAEKGTTATIALKCPAAKVGDGYCGGKAEFVKDNNFVEIRCDCGFGSKEKGTVLLWLITDIGEYPLLDALVSVDGEQIGYTPIHGFIELANLKYGTHTVDIRGKILDDESDTTPEEKQHIQKILVDAPFKEIIFRIKRDDFVKGSATDLNSKDNAEEQGWPALAVRVIFFIISAVGSALDWREVQECEKEYSGDEYIATKRCSDEFAWFIFGAIPLDKPVSLSKKAFVYVFVKNADGNNVRTLKELTLIGKQILRAAEFVPGVKNIYYITTKYGDKTIGYVSKVLVGAEIIILVDRVHTVIERDWNDAVDNINMKSEAPGKLKIYGTSVADEAIVIDQAKFEHLRDLDAIGGMQREIGEAYAETAFKELGKRVDPGISVKILNENLLKDAMEPTKNFIVTENYVLKFKEDGKNIEIYERSKIGKPANQIELSDLKSPAGEIDRLADVQGKPTIIEAKVEETINYDNTPKGKRPPKWKSSVNPDALPHVIKATEELYTDKLLPSKFPELAKSDLKKLAKPQYAIAGPFDSMDKFTKNYETSGWKKLVDDVDKAGGEPLPLKYKPHHNYFTKLARNLRKLL